MADNLETPTEYKYLQDDANSQQESAKPYVMYVPQLVIPQQSIPQNGQNQNYSYPNQGQIQIQHQQINYGQIQGYQQQQVNYHQQQNVVPVITLNHQIIKQAGTLEQNELRINITLLLLIPNIIALALTIFANNCVEFVRFFWNPMEKRFQISFLIFVSIEVMSVLSVFLYQKHFRKPAYAKIVYTIFSICYGFIFAGAFSTSYRQAPYYDYFMTRLDYGQNIFYCLGYFCLLFAGIIIFLKKYTNNYFYVIPFIIVPNLIYTGILPFLYEQNAKYVTFYIIYYIITTAFGFYYFYVLLKFTVKGYKNFRTDEQIISSIVILGLLLAPWYKFEKELPDDQQVEQQQ